MVAKLRKWARKAKEVFVVFPPEILECQDDDFINELNFSDWLEFNPSEHESAVENFESDNGTQIHDPNTQIHDPQHINTRPPTLHRELKKTKHYTEN